MRIPADFCLKAPTTKKMTPRIKPATIKTIDIDFNFFICGKQFIKKDQP